MHARGARVAAHAGRIRDIQNGVEAGVDTIEHGTELDAYTARRMRDTGTILVSTLTVFHSWLSFGPRPPPVLRRPVVPAPGARPARRRGGGRPHRPRRGVAIAAGSDPAGSARANHIGWEFQALVGAGLPPVEALAAVTWRGGEALGIADAGVLREGGRPTSSSSTATRSPIRERSGGSGATAELPATIGLHDRRPADHRPRPAQGVRRAQAVDGVSFEVAEGEVFGILGPNGAGKTTTLEMIEGMRPIDGGSATVDGLDVAADPRVGEGPDRDPAPVVGLLRGAQPERAACPRPPLPVKADAAALLAGVELTDKAKSRVKTLSGGQKQRFSIAAALVNDLRVLFLDEPTTGLDPQARRHLWASFPTFGGVGTR